MAAEKTLEESKRRRRRDVSDEAEPRTGGKGKPTPSRRDPEEDSEENTGMTSVVTSPFHRFTEYLQDVRGELSKVVWPTREEAARMTRIVLITLVVSAVVMGVISFLMSKFVEFGLNFPPALVLAFVAIVTAAVYGIHFSGTSKRGY
jgi:preprotein translocase SecE subunit